MILNGSQRKDLHAALIDAFTESSLKRLASFELNITWAKITGAGDLSDKVLTLIEFCEHQGEAYLTCLIKGAYKENPGNEKLRLFHNQYFQVSTSSGESSSSISENPLSEAKIKRYPDVSDFDLHHLINDHAKPLLEVEQKVGLIGMVIPCESETFRVKFCERLKRRLDYVNPEDRGKLRIVGVQALNPKIGTVEKVAKEIYRKCQDTLTKKRDVLYSIKVSPELQDSAYSDEFWTLLQTEFESFHFESRLIIFMNGVDKPIFPQSVPQLPMPSFDTDHVWNWIDPIARTSTWEPLFWEDIWMKCLGDKCRCPEQNILKIDRVYRFLETTMTLLKDGQLTDQDDFIDQLSFKIGV